MNTFKQDGKFLNIFTNGFKTGRALNNPTKIEQLIENGYIETKEGN